MSTHADAHHPDTGTLLDPVLPSVELQLHRPKEPGVATVVKTEVCTNPKAAGFVRHIELDVSTTNIAGRFRAGQSFGVVPPGQTDKGRAHAVRLYSIASPTRGEDGDGNVLATTVKRSIDEHWDDHSLFLGVASNYLCDLQVGDEVRVTGPSGKKFLLPENQADWNYLFFATGTGIAPGLTYLTAISRESDPHSGKRLYVQDRLDTHREEMLSLLSADNALIYVCGIAGMELGIIRGLAQHLPPDILSRFVTIDPEVAGDPMSWTRRMIHKQIKPTKRVFLEVY